MIKEAVKRWKSFKFTKSYKSSLRNSEVKSKEGFHNRLLRCHMIKIPALDGRPLGLQNPTNPNQNILISNAVATSTTINHELLHEGGIKKFEFSIF